jgi:hypothetical protein
MQSARESSLRQALKAQHFQVHEVLEADLKQHVEDLGYTATMIPVARDHADFLKQYPKSAETGADAYLDLIVGAYGYMAAGIGSSTPYRPALRIKVRLVRASDASVLMEDRIFYDPLGAPSNVVTIAPDPQYEFTDFDALMADPVNAKKGLDAAIDQSMDAAAKLLR